MEFSNYFLVILDCSALSSIWVAGACRKLRQPCICSNCFSRFAKSFRRRKDLFPCLFQPFYWQMYELFPYVSVFLHKARFFLSLQGEKVLSHFLNQAQCARNCRMMRIALIYLFQIPYHRIRIHSFRRTLSAFHFRRTAFE